jgi:hypothetical protein
MALTSGDRMHPALVFVSLPSAINLILSYYSLKLLPVWEWEQSAVGLVTRWPAGNSQERDEA